MIGLKPYNKGNLIMIRHALCLSLLLSPIGALAQTYECTRTKMARGGWVSDKIFVQLQSSGTKAEVIDAYINQVHGKAIPVEIKKMGGDKYRLKWKVRNVEIKNAGSGILSHTLMFDRAKSTFRINGRLHGYDNVISGSGTCKRS